MNRILEATTFANRTAKDLRPSAKPDFNYDGAALSPERRAQLVQKLQYGARYDLVVVGAGVTGSGVALDAATRGLKVLLLDKEDLAFGTSRWSSKLAHGGLRYLASGNIGIARRSAVERGILMETTAPHLTRALGQVVPVMDEFSTANKVLPRLGFIAGDALRIAAKTSGKTLPRSRTISADRVAELCPAVDREKTKFGYLNYDGQLFDDAALVTALARTAGGYGADVLTHCKATAIQGTTIELDLGGSAEKITVTASAIVNATGVWAGDLDKSVTVTPSRGTHLVIDANKVGNPEGALTVPVPGATNRFCFILPAQLGRCYIGLTDEPAPLEEEPSAPEEDVEWILNVVNQALKVKLTSEDVIGKFAGLRPLVQLADSGSKATADLSREHAILVHDRLVTVTGGKLTEYRLMAEQTVDRVLSEGLLQGIPTGSCVTKSTPLIGAPAQPEQSGHTDQTSDLVERADEPVAPGLGVTRGRLSFAVTHEGARTVADILDRRTRIGLVPADRSAAVPAAREVLVAAGLG
ncbi:FAD-dependent oxidoreductase [Corynebacterium macclintockiae]|uniref:glycerol-3-phosphate dehydrogenase/oxidase n=1 Tax=Corynebacterium macclintockiae TaxID=2913501 RepID=UPI003EBDB786